MVRPTHGWGRTAIQCAEPAFPGYRAAGLPKWSRAGTKVSVLGLVDDYIRRAESELNLAASQFQACALGPCTRAGASSHAGSRFVGARNLKMHARHIGCQTDLDNRIGN